MLLLGFTYEINTILSIIFALLCVSFQLILKKIKEDNNKTVKKENQIAKIPIAFYLCVSNIICLILSNFYILANY